MKKTVQWSAWIVSSLMVGMAAASDAESPSPDPYAHVRGMTISCPGAGQIWGSDAMVETMAELKAMGVNWITIHPYASIDADGTVGSGRLDRLYGDPVWLTRPIAEAHRLGLKIMIKPHIAYWGSPFSWRGEIAFDDEAAWARFFETYETWIAMVADLSRDADAFVVGTELDATVHRETEWRHIIATVRQKLDVPLSFASNWDRYDRVPFWDALDVIGIQGYFPLTAEAGLPSQARLDVAWRDLVGNLDRFGAKHGKKVILAELGYNLSASAAVTPWDYHQGGDDAEEIQRRCLTAALKSLDGQSRVTGAFLWKWFPGRSSRRGNFLKSTPAMREVIQAYWAPAE